MSSTDQSAQAAKSSRHNRLRNGLLLAALVIGAAGGGVAAGRVSLQSTSSTTATTPIKTPSGGALLTPGSSGGSGSSASSGSGGSSGSSGSSAAGAGGGSLSASGVAAQVDPGIVDVNVQLGYQGASAAGTGIVVTSSGEVLTNNHIVDGATTIRVTDVGNGRTYDARVVGTDAAKDIAVLQMVNASGLSTVKLGDSSTLQTGQNVLAIGNAGGVGGTPSSVAGAVVALHQAITATDDTGAGSEHLSGLVETTAPIQPGDSGGPLVNKWGRVVAIDTAASSGSQFQSAASQAFAIPIDTAISIANQIESGKGSSTVHIGTAAMLGIEVQAAGGGFGGSAQPGTVIAAVLPGSPAASAGLSAGDVIVSLNGQTVDSPTTLSSLMNAHHPGDRLTVGYDDSSGQLHSVTVTLAAGPPA